MIYSTKRITSALALLLLSNAACVLAAPKPQVDTTNPSNPKGDPLPPLATSSVATGIVGSATGTAGSGVNALSSPVPVPGSDPPLVIRTSTNLGKPQDKSTVSLITDILIGRLSTKPSTDPVNPPEEQALSGILLVVLSTTTQTSYFTYLNAVKSLLAMESVQKSTGDYSRKPYRISLASDLSSNVGLLAWDRDYSSSNGNVTQSAVF